MALHTEHTASPHMNYAPADLNPHKDLPKGFFDFLLPLHQQFTPMATEAGGKTRRGAAAIASRTSAKLFATLRGHDLRLADRGARLVRGSTEPDDGAG